MARCLRQLMLGNNDVARCDFVWRQPRLKRKGRNPAAVHLAFAESYPDNRDQLLLALTES
jgi:hypothetical protein